MFLKLSVEAGLHEAAGQNVRSFFWKSSRRSDCGQLHCSGQQLVWYGTCRTIFSRTFWYLDLLRGRNMSRFLRCRITFSRIVPPFPAKLLRWCSVELSTAIYKHCWKSLIPAWVSTWKIIKMDLAVVFTVSALRFGYVVLYSYKLLRLIHIMYCLKTRWKCWSSALNLRCCYVDIVARQRRQTWTNFHNFFTVTFKKDLWRKMKLKLAPPSNMLPCEK